MMRTATLLTVSLLCLGFSTFSGCASSSSSVNAPSTASLVDSLRTANERLSARVRQLSDSLQFYDDIQSGQYRREQRAIQDDLTRLAYEVTLLREGGQSIETLATDSLFEPGSTRLTDDARDRLRTIAARLRTTYRNRIIRVEAHTDNQPPADSSYASGRALSAGRAAAVVDLLVDLSDRDAADFRAVALGAAQPVASNETRSGQARNRRIRIMVLPPRHQVPHPYELSW
ncbi:MAG: OmpA family protein [Longimonas sp.]|uniref:OmpA/MotB family protein n=1 Tax=Longimonas sp. TaxID=2039626 RepID=UPI003974EA67